MRGKPIRVFWSPLSHRFYATRAYKEIKPGVIECTGDRFDVTNDIAELVIRHDITFAPMEAISRERTTDE